MEGREAATAHIAQGSHKPALPLAHLFTSGSSLALVRLVADMAVPAQRRSLESRLGSATSWLVPWASQCLSQEASQQLL